MTKVRFFQAYFLVIRTFLHVCLAAVVFLALMRWTNWPMTFFMLVFMPINVAMEYLQHFLRVSDSAGHLVLVRDTSFTFLVLVSFFCIYYFKQVISAENKIFLLIGLMISLVIVSVFIEPLKPEGKHHEYKHILDVISYTLGPLVYFFILGHLF